MNLNFFQIVVCLGYVGYISFLALILLRICTFGGERVVGLSETIIVVVHEGVLSTLLGHLNIIHYGALLLLVLLMIGSNLVCLA